MDYLIGITCISKNSNSIITHNKNKLQEILELVNELNIQEANYLIKCMNKAKIKKEKEI